MSMVEARVRLSSCISRSARYSALLSMDLRVVVESRLSCAGAISVGSVSGGAGSEDCSQEMKRKKSPRILHVRKVIDLKVEHA